MSYFLNLIETYHLTFFSFLIAFSGAFLLGVGKAGVKGLGVLIVLLMAIVFGGKTSTGVLIPLMVVADIFAVIYYHRHTQWAFLLKLLPTMVLGVLIGVWLGNDISEVVFKELMAVLILVTLVIMIVMERKKSTEIPTHWAFSSSMGLISGITSMIGNLAGSFTDIYFLAMRLPKNEFIGTAAWLFFIINVFKLPFHIFIWKTVTFESLGLNLILIPGIVLGFFTGVKIVKQINNSTYRKFIFIATAFGALLILFK
ncbi:sulfite exporter TauE/SafE family protein [Lutibacter sp. HS1-25]|uniref:sulfite exporter TauE/SafE family protein n=1 Tax=Lutibacter sp. HS1-25 TaxID=2485000 RepID=UPI001F0B740F|nr:sulfite exporter TauE/SafE family protein [Lutibacter sp. HS1-25]